MQDSLEETVQFNHILVSSLYSPHWMHRKALAAGLLPPTSQGAQMTAWTEPLSPDPGPHQQSHQECVTALGSQGSLIILTLYPAHPCLSFP